MNNLKSLATFVFALCLTGTQNVGAEIFDYRLTGQVWNTRQAPSGSDVEALFSVGDTYTMEFSYDNSNEIPRDPDATLAQFFPPLVVRITYSNGYHAEAYSGRILVANDRSGSDSFTPEMVYDDPQTSGPVLSGPEVGNSHLVLLQLQLLDTSGTAFDSVDLGALPPASAFNKRHVEIVFWNELGERSDFKATVDTLEIATASVTFETSGFVGVWTLIDDTDNSVVFSGTGDQTAELEPGIYQIDIGTNLDYIEVEANGNVISANPVTYTGGQGQVTFNTALVLIDPALYHGLWGILGVVGYNTVTDPGPQVLTLVRNLDYSVRIAGSSTSQFNIAIDGAGMVSSLNPDAASAAGDTLTFNTTDMYIDPGLYPGAYAVWGVVGFDATSQPGIQSVKLLPALNYNVRITGIIQSQFTIGLSASGLVTSFNTDAATGMADMLLLNTTTIMVDPGAYTGPWQVRGAFGSHGIDWVELPPGLGYKFFLSSTDTLIFSVSEPCAVNPNQFTLAGESFSLSCGTPDADDDGVPDDDDNCPQTPNPDQVDQDIDDIGNLCDDDLDGDGVDNQLDNCPDIENINQQDLDGDDIGDACDNDADGDSVNDAVDNCPGIANTDQSDNDLDQSGDVCDVDDDNDVVPDVADNCPLHHNPGQEDIDLNGQGDVCDGDVDGDGVSNQDDLCELSAQSSLVNADGCTGPQFIALICVATDFVQHGKYVSCVAHAANDAVDQGLITSQEMARIVREAAKSK